LSLVIYTDGASRGNPGKGGYGIVLQWGAQHKELSAGYRFTTNNRMELLAVIKALEALTREGLVINVFTDSEYVVNAIEKGWVFGWEKKQFAGKKNADLWQQFLKLYRKHNIKMNWVKGHANNIGNNRCDQLATQAADSGNLLIDTVYEAEYYAQ
jgi:ribonuclease HI